jgi:polyribonucleotide nucleotidyltransferase
MFTTISKTFQFGNSTVTLETGRVARQADGAVLVTIDEKTQVLCAVTAAKSAAPGQSFFPLTVHYIEKYYSVGKIPGGYLKREGRPSEKETLTSRLIDRPIRPLFPNGFQNEVNVICTVMSADKNVDPDIAALIATSAALAISGVPFAGPIGAARVAYTEEEGYSLNPTVEQLTTSKLDMVVAGTKDAVLMVESEADVLDEDTMLGAVLFAHDAMQSIVTAVSEFATEVGKETWDWKAPVVNTPLLEAVTAEIGNGMVEAYTTTDKMERYSKLDALKSKVVSALAGEEEGQASASEVSGLFGKVQKQTVRRRVVDGEPRIDGRDNKTVRAIDTQIDILDSVHGSSLFTRGETQAIVTCTLGSGRDAQMVDFLHGRKDDPFLFHYNFPPYSVGEVGRFGGTGRREIGHGRLARRGVQAMLPSQEDFPYTIRIVSEITESNGSSSMASVCGASLAMMDAGVPIKAPIAGIAMGLIKEDDGFAVLTDILGDEDHLGDMDFKVAGTEAGITALQMDIKIEGITEEIMEIALEQALEARLHILREMSSTIGYARPEMPANAPTMTSIKVHPDKIRDIIGKGGATIRSICEESGAEVDINDEGIVRIFATDKAGADAAMLRIESITAEAEIGATYTGKVARIVDFGAFVSILPGKDGLVHISQISDERVENVTDFLKEGQDIKVKVLDVDNRGRIKLTMRNIEETAPAAE